MVGRVGPHSRCHFLSSFFPLPLATFVNHLLLLLAVEESGDLFRFFVKMLFRTACLGSVCLGVDIVRYFLPYSFPVDSRMQTLDEQEVWLSLQCDRKVLESCRQTA